MKWESINWMCMRCSLHNMSEAVAFGHAQRLKHKIVIQTEGDATMMTNTAHKFYTPEEKAELVLRGEVRFAQHIIGDMAAHPSSCKCMPCFAAYWEEQKKTIDSEENI